jgi:acyl CoA:acetate/3-ketoacid CoA transferase alpha subunit
MRTISLYLTLLFFMACNQQDSNQNSQTQTKAQNMDSELIGIWNSDQSDEATKNSVGKVTMTFTEDGQLIYDIDAGGKLQRMNMVYKVIGDTIISDQPSHPQEQRTKFKIENDDKLTLEFEGEKTVFIRATKKVSSFFDKLFRRKQNLG